MLNKMNILVAVIMLSAMGFSKQVIKCDKCKEEIIEYSLVDLRILSKQVVFDGIDPYIQVSSNTEDSLVSVDDIHNTNNMFLTMIGTAFANHYPIELSPDDIWLMILSGVEEHIVHNKEKFKNKFVLPKSDTSIRIINNEISVVSADSIWNKAITQLFDELSKKQPKETFEHFDVGFSTTNITDKNIIKTKMLGMSSKYFSYEMITLCGIPRIVLLGEKSDWEELRQKFTKLANYFEMNWWAIELNPVLDQFVNAFNSKIDVAFWNGIYKYHESKRSGEVNGVNGWITKFFPYVDSVQRIEWKKPIKENKIPSGISEFEIKWININEIRTLYMRTGFVGIQASKKENILKSTRGYILLDVTDLKNKQ